MPKLKLTKADIKNLKHIADRLPPSFIEMDVMRAVPGETLLRHGVDQVKEKPVQKDKTYLAKVSDKMWVDHLRRMKRIYESGKGMDGVKAYVDGVLEVNRKKDITVGGIKLVS
jgi:cell division protein FtsI/penicillin-binding protein 2